MLHLEIKNILENMPEPIFVFSNTNSISDQRFMNSAFKEMIQDHNIPLIHPSLPFCKRDLFVKTLHPEEEYDN